MNRMVKMADIRHVYRISVFLLVYFDAAEIATYLDDLYKEAARPGQSVREVTE